MTDTAPCPHCQRRIAVIRQPGQLDARLADHWAAGLLLCQGSGVSVRNARIPLATKRAS